MKIFHLILIFFTFEISIFAGGGYALKYPTNNGIDIFFNGKITGIDLNKVQLSMNKWVEYNSTTNVTYFNNGLLIVENEFYRFFVYNEYFNENISNNFKLNNNITIFQSELKSGYTIILNENSIIIEDIIHYSNDYRIEMHFDDHSKRLIFSNTERYYKNEKLNRWSYYYEYQYDIFDRLECVYRIYDNYKFLVKSIYYDGIYRELSHPYFTISDEILPDKEIIIYDNNKIKYYVRTYPQESDHATSPIVEIEEARRYLLVIEFDENGNDIIQTISREKSEYFDESIRVYSIYNEEYDQANNWVKQNIYHTSNYNPTQLVFILSRQIYY